MTEKIYRDADVDMAPLQGKTVAVIGYGIQGKAQAANARDSNTNWRWLPIRYCGPPVTISTPTGPM